MRTHPVERKKYRSDAWCKHRHSHEHTLTRKKDSERQRRTRREKMIWIVWFRMDVSVFFVYVWDDTGKVTHLEHFILLIPTYHQSRTQYHEYCLSYAIFIMAIVRRLSIALARCDIIVCSIDNQIYCASRTLYQRIRRTSSNNNNNNSKNIRNYIIIIN